MVSKHVGACPFCKEQIKAVVIEENTVRRDKCSCPSCDETIFVCRTPGCDDYAKGGDVYDEELCPDCTKTVTKVGAGAVFLALLGRLGL
jgi:ribosomal protein S27AE